MNNFLHTLKTLTSFGKFFLLVPWGLDIFSCQMQFGPDSQAEMLSLTHGTWHIRAAPCRGCAGARPQPSPQIPGHPQLVHPAVLASV